MQKTHSDVLEEYSHIFLKYTSSEAVDTNRLYFKISKTSELNIKY